MDTVQDLVDHLIDSSEEDTNNLKKLKCEFESLFKHVKEAKDEKENGKAQIQ